MNISAHPIGTNRPWAPLWLRLASLGALVLGASYACAAPKSSLGADGSFENGTGGQSAGVGDDGAAPGDDGSAPPPEEVEDEGSFRAPVATGTFLWSANPESGRVALIDVRDSTIRLTTAGLRPTYVFAVPDADDQPSALVQNVGSSDASLLRFDGRDISERRIATPSTINRWTVSKSGRVGIAWSSAEGRRADEGALDPTEGLQEILVVRLDRVAPPGSAGASGEPGEDASARLTVGYRPQSVIISEDEERAVVVSEDGLNVLDLTEGARVDTWISLGIQGGIDTSVTRDANFAVVRRAGAPEFEVVDIDDPASAFSVTMSSPVTDLDLGEGGRVLAVAREAGEVLTFSLEELTAPGPSLSRVFVQGAVVGSAVLTSDARRAVLYTTAAAEDQVTLLDLTPGENFLSYRSVSTKLSVKGIATTPSGGHAVVVGESNAEDQGGFSIVTLGKERFPRVVGTAAPVLAVALSDTSLLVTTHREGRSEAYVGRLPELTVDSLTLASEPLSSGLVEAEGIGYVAQSHREGRVTFFEFSTNKVRSVSGFELSAEVIDE